MKHTTGRQQVNLADLETRVLDAARSEEPSAELRARMASGIGLSAAVLTRVALEKASQTGSAPHAQELVVTTRKGATTLWNAWVPWVSGVVVVGAVAGTVVATRPAPQVQAPAPSPVVQPRSASDDVVAGQVVESVSGAPVALEVLPRNDVTHASEPVESRKVVTSSERFETPSSVRQSTAASTDLRIEIALVDAARAATRGGAHARALGLLRDYDTRYPKGSFRPEVTVLRIEALAKSGQTAEASRLAQSFVSNHAGSPLAERVEKYR